MKNNSKYKIVSMSAASGSAKSLRPVSTRRMAGMVTVCFVILVQFFPGNSTSFHKISTEVAIVAAGGTSQATTSRMNNQTIVGSGDETAQTAESINRQLSQVLLANLRYRQISKMPLTLVLASGQQVSARVRLKLTTTLLQQATSPPQPAPTEPAHQLPDSDLTASLQPGQAPQSETTSASASINATTARQNTNRQPETVDETKPATFIPTVETVMGLHWPEDSPRLQTGKQLSFPLPQTEIVGVPVQPSIDNPFPDEQPYSGNFYRAHSGSTVIAPFAGYVMFAEQFKDMGRTIIISHRGGWYSILAGLADLAVTSGEWVETRQLLGTMPITEPVLFFEVRQGVNPISPHPLIASLQQ